MTKMNECVNHALDITRRHFLKGCPIGLGGLAFALLNGEARTDQPQDPANPLAPRPPHYAAKAKRVIYLHMAGSPSQLDIFDYKPELVRRNGEDCPQEFLQGRRFAFTTGTPKLLGTPQRFARHGRCGAWASETVPQIASIVDELCFIKSMFSEQFNHAPAELLLFTGSPQFGRPSIGSWVTYGLGSESQNLPGFIVLVSSGSLPSGGNGDWSNGFLPSIFQGVQCRSHGDPVLFVSNPHGIDQSMRRHSLDALRDLNEMQAAELGNPETRTRIAQYEMAFRMQTAVPEVMDIGREPRHVLEAYGAVPGVPSFNNNCLLARRLLEQGVRFVQLHDWGWDFHGVNPQEDIREGLRTKCRGMDRATAALIRDLKSRGLLDDTLVIWGGEFGRSPFREGRTANSQFVGRDHHPFAFTIFVAGAGIKPGLTYGASDELGFDVAEKPVHIHDLQATVLHLLGMEHTRLTYRFQGRDFRLTDVHGEVVHDILA
jgi:Protein of unknown function (DUF1501)